MNNYDENVELYLPDFEYFESSIDNELVAWFRGEDV